MSNNKKISPTISRLTFVKNSGIAAATGIAAPGLGLGTTFTGSINSAVQGHPPLIGVLGLPEGYIPHATCVIGYPAEQYHRIPVRKPVDVKWI